MKKKYMIPHVEIVTVETNSLMAASRPYMEVDPKEDTEINESKWHSFDVFDEWDEGDD